MKPAYMQLQQQARCTEKNPYNFKSTIGGNNAKTFPIFKSFYFPGLEAKSHRYILHAILQILHKYGFPE